MGLGKLLGGLLGETENEQENFLLGKLLSGIMGEVEGVEPDAALHSTARWFVRLARHVARRVVASIVARRRAGETVGPHAVRRIVFEAILSAAPATRGHRSGPAATQGGSWSSGVPGASRGSGRWTRRGSRIVIHL